MSRLACSPMPLVFVALGFLAGRAEGEMIPPDTPVPIDRLVDNLTLFVQGHPEDPHGYYLLGRVHALGAVDTHRSFQTYGLPVEPEKHDRPALFVDSLGLRPWGPMPGVPLGEAQKHHLQEAVRHYSQAVRLAMKGDPGWLSPAWLGLAYICETGSKFATSVPWPADAVIESEIDGPAGELDSKEWLRRALVAYKNAYRIHSKSTYQDEAAVGAGDGILRVYESLGKKEHVGEFSIRRIRKNLDRMNSLPRVMSPIIFSLDGPREIQDLLAPDQVVKFDLDGFARGSSWPWLKPDTFLLVWDPNRTGHINSGRQLFGSVTWWVFWKDGYQALAALDDNADGWLRGAELSGIGAWTDRNSNATSDPGEVISIELLGVTGIATQVTGYLRSGEPYAKEGIELGGSTVLPTYDWMPQRIGK